MSGSRQRSARRISRELCMATVRYPEGLRRISLRADVKPTLSRFRHWGFGPTLHPVFRLRLERWSAGEAPREPALRAPSTRLAIRRVACLARTRAPLRKGLASPALHRPALARRRGRDGWASLRMSARRWLSRCDRAEIRGIGISSRFGGPDAHRIQQLSTAPVDRSHHPPRSLRCTRSSKRATLMLMRRRRST
jgi:hypothetical protein